MILLYYALAFLGIYFVSALFISLSVVLLYDGRTYIPYWLDYVLGIYCSPILTLLEKATGVNAELIEENDDSKTE